MTTQAAASKPAPEPEDPRYSVGKKDIGDAKNFRWECAVPSNKFWDDLEFVQARNFIQAVTPAEFESFPINPNSTQTIKEKQELLLKLLQDKLMREDATAAPQTFYDVNYKAWQTLWLGIHTFKLALGHSDVEAVLCMMIDGKNKKDPTNLSLEHSLSSLLFDRGQYAEAEALERRVLKWLVGCLGATSPQALGSRRIIAQSAWKQGSEKIPDAKALFEEVSKLIEESREGKYAVYADEQNEITDKIVKDLQEGRL